MPENIDDEFYEAMRSIGGLRPVEIDPEAGKALNADIVFRDENVVLEIKTLMVDPSQRADYNEKVNAIYNRWVGRPGVPIIFGQRTINSTEVPPEMGRELVRTLAGPIRGAVTKANSQIRKVKGSLNMPDAHGVLLLCNAGATTMAPNLILHTLHHALGNQHTSINSAIYLTHGVPVRLPSMPVPGEVFALVRRPGYDPLCKVLGAKIRDAWMRHQARKQPVQVYSGVDERELLDAANVLKHPS